MVKEFYTVQLNLHVKVCRGVYIHSNDSVQCKYFTNAIHHIPHNPIVKLLFAHPVCGNNSNHNDKIVSKSIRTLKNSFN